MRYYYNTILLLFLGIVLSLSFVSAVESLPAVKYNECVALTQVEFNSNYQNISSIYIQGKNKTMFNPQISMTKSGYAYNYTYCNTTALGTYIVEGCSNLDCWSYDFEVTVNGQEVSIFQGIVYGLVLFLLLIIFGLCMYGAFHIPSENVRGGEGEIIKVEYKKYAKWFCILMCYIVSMWIIFIAWNLSYAFLYFDAITSMFRVLYKFYHAIMWPVIVCSVIFGVTRYITDLKLEEKLNRGLTVK